MNASDAAPIGPAPATEQADPTMSELEVRKVSGYAQPARQLRELQRQGFYRARLSATTGRVILERAHYEAVCAGAAGKAANDPKARPRPNLRA